MGEKENPKSSKEAALKGTARPLLDGSLHRIQEKLAGVPLKKGTSDRARTVLGGRRRQRGNQCVSEVAEGRHFVAVSCLTWEKALIEGVVEKRKVRGRPGFTKNQGRETGGTRAKRCAWRRRADFGGHRGGVKALSGGKKQLQRAEEMGRYSGQHKKERT